MFYLLIALGSLLEAAGDVYFRKQAYLLGGPLYIIGSALWALSLRYGTLSKGIALFMILNVLIDVFAGMYVLGEHMTPSQWVGVGLGIIAITLLS